MLAPLPCPAQVVSLPVQLQHTQEPQRPKEKLDFPSYMSKTSPCSVPSLRHSSSRRTAPDCDHSASYHNHYQRHGATKPPTMLPTLRRVTCWVAEQAALIMMHKSALLQQTSRAATS